MTPDFRAGAIKPVDCIKEGWALIKDQYWLFFGISLVGILVGGVVPIILLGPMMVGIFMCLLQRLRGEPVEFGTLFKGFDLFVPGLIVAVIKIVPVLIVIVPYYIIMVSVMMANMPRGGGPPEDPSAFIASMLGTEIVFGVVVMVVSLVVELLFMFAFPLVADRKMSGMDAIKLSLKAAKANFGGILGLLLLNFAFSMLGVLCCFIGVYFYIPVTFASYAVAYRRVFPEVPETFISPPPPPGSWA
jgi:uncharacterized membrane protein